MLILQSCCSSVYIGSHRQSVIRLVYFNSALEMNQNPPPPHVHVPPTPIIRPNSKWSSFIPSPLKKQKKKHYHFIKMIDQPVQLSKYWLWNCLNGKWLNDLYSVCAVCVYSVNVFMKTRPCFNYHLICSTMI